MKDKLFALSFLLILLPSLTGGQDNLTYKLRLSIPVADLPQNIKLPGSYPSMGQALDWSDDLYELGNLGIDELGDRLFIRNGNSYNGWKRYTNNAFKYLLSMAFSKYGSELPVPLGVWGHEEFHRSVLGVNDITSKNGNWLLNRWDGTVFGLSDLTLGNLKTYTPDQLLYSYVAGIQYEVLLNEKVTLGDFYKKRSMTKAALLLYNAWYVYDYFSFSTSPASDSVKINAPPHESRDPLERDFAGADLTAWIYDMFNPGLPFTSRDNFPGGEGVNRRIGFSDLSGEAQDYLNKQKRLSLLNFLNPAIFFIDRIKINEHIDFNIFAQYSPAHFGNHVAVFLPFRYRNYDLLLNLRRYAGDTGKGTGLGLGLYNYFLTKKIQADITADLWDQPESFFGDNNISGGSLGIKTRYAFRNNLSGFVSVSGKSKGWMPGNPYLRSNASLQMGLCYYLSDLAGNN